jgi:hypothetical protein
MDRGVAQSGSALDWGSRGRRFESCRPDHKYSHSFYFINIKIRSLIRNFGIKPILNSSFLSFLDGLAGRGLNLSDS